MKCSHCGKELIEVTQLTEEEIKEFEFFSCKMRNAEAALQSDIIDVAKMSQEQIYSYFKAAYDLKCEAEFLNFCFFDKLSKRVNQPRNALLIDQGKVWIHGDN